MKHIKEFVDTLTSMELRSLRESVKVGNIAVPSDIDRKVLACYRNDLQRTLTEEEKHQIRDDLKNFVKNSTAIQKTAIKRSYSSTKLLYTAKRGNRYVSKIKVNGKSVHVGSFATAYEAHTAAVQKKQALQQANKQGIFRKILAWFK